MEADQALLEYVVKAFVAHPEAVLVERTPDSYGILLTLTVHPEDMGAVIGKKGKMADALRTLLHAAGAKRGASVNLKLAEPEGGKRAAELGRPDHAP